MSSLNEGEINKLGPGRAALSGGQPAHCNASPGPQGPRDSWAGLPAAETRVEQVAREILEELALYLDLNQLVGRALARVEVRRRLNLIATVSDAQIESSVREAVEEQLREDFRRMESGYVERCYGNDRDDYLVTEVGVRASCVYLAVVAYNALLKKERRAFIFALRGDVDLGALVGTEWKTQEEFVEDFLTALAALMVRPKQTP